MKEIKLYICEVCGTQYKNKVDCERCEKGHRKSLQIFDARYLSLAQDASGMPITITLLGSDGKQYRYKR